MDRGLIRNNSSEFFEFGHIFWVPPSQGFLELEVRLPESFRKYRFLVREIKITIIPYTMSGGMNTFSVLVIVEKPSPPSPGLMPLRTAPKSDCLQPSVLLMGLLDRENLMDPDDPRLFVDTVERGIGTGNMKPVYFPAAP